ncbi:MAG: hypothetical protein QM736_08725 [Vicinamibacterales bacterium]
MIRLFAQAQEHVRERRRDDGAARTTGEGTRVEPASTDAGERKER